MPRAVQLDAAKSRFSRAGAPDASNGEDVADVRRRTLEALAAEVGPRGFRIARDLLGSDAGAEDAVQEALARACEAAGRLRDPGALHGWFFRVLTNLCMRSLRRRRVRNVALGWLARSTRSAAPAVGHTKDVRALLAALAELPPRQHAALVLRYGHELTVPEVARLLGVGPETVKTHMARGLRRLREVLDVES